MFRGAAYREGDGWQAPNSPLARRTDSREAAVNTRTIAVIALVIAVIVLVILLL